MMDPGGGEFDPRPDLRCARDRHRESHPRAKMASGLARRRLHFRDFFPSTVSDVGCYGVTFPLPRADRLVSFPPLLSTRSGTWETHAVDNQAGFLEAFGSAFATGVPGHVNAKELHSLAHDREAGVLEDTAMLGDTAVVNRTEVGKPREIVAPDGSAMRVTARWDGDVWVEVDEDLVLETRRWREGDFLVFARTVHARRRHARDVQDVHGQAQAQGARVRRARAGRVTRGEVPQVEQEVEEVEEVR